MSRQKIQAQKADQIFMLDGKVALVTGAAGHLGQSIVKALCETGAHVILNGRTAAKIEQLAEKMINQGYKVSTAIVDITNERELIKYFKRFNNDRLDIIVNNAYAGKSGCMEGVSENDFALTYQVVVTAAFRIIQLARPFLETAAKQNSGGASVINIASMYGTVSPDLGIYGNSGLNNPPYYGAAKAALIQLTRYMACQLAPAGIRVNCISPGPFPREEIVLNNPQFYKELCRKNPMNRIGRPDELKGPVLFLASDASSYVTGINLPVDGGWTTW